MLFPLLFPLFDQPVIQMPLFTNIAPLSSPVKKSVPGHKRLRKKERLSCSPSLFFIHRSRCSVSFRFTAAGRTIPAKWSLLKTGFKPGILTGTGHRLGSPAGRFRSRTGSDRLVAAAAVSAVIVVTAIVSVTAAAIPAAKKAVPVLSAAKQ